MKALFMTINKTVTISMLLILFHQGISLAMSKDQIEYLKGKLSPETIELAQQNMKEEFQKHPQFNQLKTLYKKFLTDQSNLELSNELSALSQAIRSEAQESLINRGFENLYQECCREEQSKNS
jgi:hypothetical protein